MNENFKKIYKAFAELNDSGFICNIGITPTLKQEEQSAFNNNMDKLIYKDMICIERGTKFKVKELKEVIYPLLDKLKDDGTIVDYRKRDSVEIYFL